LLFFILVLGPFFNFIFFLLGVGWIHVVSLHVRLLGSFAFLAFLFLHYSLNFSLSRVLLVIVTQLCYVVMSNTKPQCGGGNQSGADDYDLPLHVAAICESSYLQSLKQELNSRSHCYGSIFIRYATC
jgi:hypothetical protein